MGHYVYLRCTRELPQTPAGAPAPRGAAGLHAKSGAAWAAWGRDQGWPLNQHCDSPPHARITANSRWGACSSWRCRAACQVWSSLGSLGPRSGSEPSSRISRVFPVHDRALRSMKTLIGCRNDGQGTGSPTASTCLAAGRRAVDESSPVLFSKIYPSLGSRRPDGFRECGSPVPNSMTSKRRRDNLTRGGGGDKGTRARTGLLGSKNHTFFILGWCAAEMRRIIDVSCLPGAGS